MPISTTSSLTSHPLYAEFVEWRDALARGEGVGGPLGQQFQQFTAGARRRAQDVSSPLAGGATSWDMAEAEMAEPPPTPLSTAPLAGAVGTLGRAGLGALGIQGAGVLGGALGFGTGAMPSLLSPASLTSLGGGLLSLGGLASEALGGPPELGAGLSLGGSLLSGASGVGTIAGLSSTAAAGAAGGMASVGAPGVAAGAGAGGGAAGGAMIGGLGAGLAGAGVISAITAIVAYNNFLHRQRRFEREQRQTKESAGFIESQMPYYRDVLKRWQGGAAEPREVLDVGAQLREHIPYVTKFSPGGEVSPLGDLWRGYWTGVMGAPGAGGLEAAAAQHPVWGEAMRGGTYDRRGSFVPSGSGQAPVQGDPRTGYAYAPPPSPRSFADILATSSRQFLGTAMPPAPAAPVTRDPLASRGFGYFST